MKMQKKKKKCKTTRRFMQFSVPATAQNTQYVYDEELLNAPIRNTEHALA